MRVSTLLWMCSDENIFDSSFRSSLICFRISSCLLKSQSAVSNDTFSLLADESILVFCCLSWYVSFNCLIYSYYYLLIWYHCSWNTFSLLAKESINSCCCLSIKILCCLSWYVYLNRCSSHYSCLLLWSHCSWNSFILMAGEWTKSFCSYIWLYGVSMASGVFIASCFKNNG